MLKQFLVLFSLILFTGCFSNEGFYNGLKHSQKIKEDRYPNQNVVDEQEKKDQSYKEYIDEIEKSKF